MASRSLLTLGAATGWSVSEESSAGPSSTYGAARGRAGECSAVADGHPHVACGCMEGERGTHAAEQKLVMRASSRWPDVEEDDVCFATLCGELRQRFHPERAEF